MIQASRPAVATGVENASTKRHCPTAYCNAVQLRHLNTNKHNNWHGYGRLTSVGLANKNK